MDATQRVAIATRRRGLYTGSAELYAHLSTDHELESIVDDELAAREAAGVHHDVRRMQRAAAFELAWRAEVGLRFGWTSR